MLTDAEEAAQFAQAKPLVEAMFDMSVDLVTRRGNFLPYGGTLAEDGTVAYISAADDRDQTDATRVMPLVHDAVRARLKDSQDVAVAISDSVFIGAEGEPAIKVLVEHRGGMCRALYMPFRTRMLRKPTFGDVKSVKAAPEVGGWNN